MGNIAGTSKITRSGRIFSPEIAPPRAIFRPSNAPKVTHVPVNIFVRTPVIEEIVTPEVVPSAVADDRGKWIQEEPVRMRAQLLIIPETSQKEMEEILKIIKRSDYNVVEQLGKTPSKISMLALLLCSEAHAKALIIFLKTAHMPQETSTYQF